MEFSYKRRDDAGHESIVTTEGYSDVEIKDRYRSVKDKTVDVKSDIDADSV